MRAITLLFHDVVPAGQWASSGFSGADADLYKLDCDEFRKHLKSIRSRLRHDLTTGPELLAGNQMPSPVLLTFDDGGVSGARYIVDMLDEYNWKAHFFITAGRIGTAGFLDRQQIRDLRRRGHLIGTHSYSHPARMAYCSPRQLEEEWRNSIAVLAEILGEPIPLASVPGGYYSRRVAETAAAAGIKLLFNSEPVIESQKIDGCVVLGRFSAKRGAPPEWSAAVVAGDHWVRMREYLVWNAKKTAKAVLGMAWLSARKKLLEHRARRAH
jgi:peptidoglycan/xylan/chitin deacetylase (PgdA/CDA1 family)